MESISGLPVNVKFISFADIVENGIPEDIDVIINAGTVNDAWAVAALAESSRNRKDYRVCQRGRRIHRCSEPSALDTASSIVGPLIGRRSEASLVTRLKDIGMKQLISTSSLLVGSGKIDFGKFIDEIFVLGPETRYLLNAAVLR